MHPAEFSTPDGRWSSETQWHPADCYRIPASRPSSASKVRRFPVQNAIGHVFPASKASGYRSRAAKPAAATRAAFVTGRSAVPDCLWQSSCRESRPKYPLLVQYFSSSHQRRRSFLPGSAVKCEWQCPRTGRKQNNKSKAVLRCVDILISFSGSVWLMKGVPAETTVAARLISTESNSIHCAAEGLLSRGRKEAAAIYRHCGSVWLFRQSINIISGSGRTGGDSITVSYGPGRFRL